MNCKPGDLAVCIREAQVPCPVSPLGKLCTVLYAAPPGEFRLPDGYRQMPNRLDDGVHYWVVEWQKEIAYPLEWGGYRYTRYGLAPDHALRPIRDPGDDAVDETLRRVEEHA